MTTMEWATLDKSAWGEGEWSTEPDKKQWTDSATGLPCLAVRSRAGNWCGYVGIPPGHPWHGKDYSSCTLPPATKRGARDGDDRFGSFARRLAERDVCTEDYCSHTPESLMEVHGGLTFADRCASTSIETWRAWSARLRARVDEARQYPNGDAAHDLRDYAAAINGHAAYVELVRSRFICHLPEPGEPEDVWWFGFDCSHAWDVSPGYERTYRSFANPDSTYRTLSYVEGECAKLAGQLADVVTRNEANG